MRRRCYRSLARDVKDHLADSLVMIDCRFHQRLNLDVIMKTRLDIGLVMLVIVPWTIVLVTLVRWWTLPVIPPSLGHDSQEIRNIALALQRMADKYGGYPPDFSSGNPRKEIDEYLAGVFPNRDRQLDVPSALDQLGPDNALVFWLNGIFESNPVCPLTGKIPVEEPTELEKRLGVSTTSNAQPWFNDMNRWYTFDSNRIDMKDGYRLRCSSVPLVYFRATSYENASFAGAQSWGVARPYRRVSLDGKVGFAEPSRFQIICTGHDQTFGNEIATVGSAYRHDGHADNFTNFAPEMLGGKRIRQLHKQTKTTLWVGPLLALFSTVALYPGLFYLRHRDDQATILRSGLAKQYHPASHSESWQETLALQRRRRREQAKQRMTSLSDS